MKTILTQLPLLTFSFCLLFGDFVSICFADDVATLEVRELDEDKLKDLRDIVNRRTQSEIFSKLGEKPVPKKIIDDSELVIKATDILLESGVLEKNDPEQKIIAGRSWVLKRRILALVYLSYDEVKMETFFPILVNDVSELEEYKDCAQIMRFAEEHILRIASMLVISDDRKIKIVPNALAQWYVDHVNRYPGRSSEQLVIHFLDKVKELHDLGASDKIMTACASRFREILLASRDEMTIARGKKMEPAVRWFDLPGKEMHLTGTDIDGNVFNIEDLKGKVVLVEFWGTWCMPCVRDFPMLAGYYEDFKKRGFEIVGVNTGVKSDTEAYVKKFVQETTFAGNKKINWLILLDGLKTDVKERITTYYGIETLPKSVLIGMDGKVIALNPPKDTLHEQIQKALNSPIDPDTLTPEQRKLWEQKKIKDAAELEETKRFAENIKLPNEE
ncbi:MAG: TlpA family protein disulfide reductase [Planctomycetaceae bacterium]|jgi:thiol-disulfide isomerase/thioredoxin|nr:TlpA family protein disulfide reductase [Planctomycetaceae bacterium]